jgi:hypothetical protein
MGYFSQKDLERQEAQGPETVSDVDWKKAFSLLEYLARTRGLTEEVEDIVKTCTYQRPAPADRFQEVTR